MMFPPPWVSVALCSSVLPVYDHQFGYASVLLTYVRLPGRNFCQAYLLKSVTCFVFVFMPRLWIHICEWLPADSFRVTM